MASCSRSTAGPARWSPRACLPLAKQKRACERRHKLKTAGSLIASSSRSRRTCPMKKLVIVSAAQSSKRYLARRTTELASPATRSLTEPLADWALKKIRLEGRPFSFQGHEYLRAIYDDQAPWVVVSKAAQVGGSTWAILRS